MINSEIKIGFHDVSHLFMHRRSWIYYVVNFLNFQIRDSLPCVSSLSNSISYPLVWEAYQLSTSLWLLLSCFFLFWCWWRWSWVCFVPFFWWISHSYRFFPHWGICPFHAWRFHIFFCQGILIFPLCDNSFDSDWRRLYHHLVLMCPFLVFTNI